MTNDIDQSQRSARWPWLIGGAVLVVAAVAVTLLLTAGHAGNGNRPAAATNTASGSDYDLSSPQAAAESFARAAKTGSGDTLLDLACVGRPACVREHAPTLTEAQLTEARTFIREGVFELAEHLKGAEFTTPVEGTTPGTKNVPYHTPAMAGDASLTLTFVQSGGEWLYYQPA